MSDRVIARRRVITLVAVAVGWIAWLGCAGKDAALATTAARRNDTSRMADTLAVLAAKGVEQPMSNPFLNSERAQSLRVRIAAQGGGPESFNTRNWLADELLKAGKTREAIGEIESLMRDAHVSRDTIPLQKKAVFDLLAIASLRLAEQENCLGNSASNVCILPLEGAARHTHEEGARDAVARYTQLLHFFPDDHGSRYLLNIAWLALGGYPDSVPKQYLIPSLAPRADDPFPRYPNVAGNVGLGVTGLAGGLSIEDFNGDGLLDLFMTSWAPNDPVHLFLADGRGGYVDRTATSGLKGIVGGVNTVHADYDNDGDVDILVLRGGWLGEAGKFPNSLLRNRGDGTFEDVTFSSGILSFNPTHSAAWADFNLDGYLDLFVGNESSAPSGGPSHRSELFLNNRNGTFTEVSHQVGIDVDDFVKGVAWGDVNNDGLPDLYVSVFAGANQLYINRGGNSSESWKFEERGAAAGVNMATPSFPTWFWDFDNDGFEDLLVMSYDLSAPLHETVALEYLGLPLKSVRDGKLVAFQPSRLYRNKGDGTFEDVTRRVGLADKAIYAMGSNFGDLDNDGWLDFYVGTGNPDLRSIVPNRMFHNVNGRRFEEVTLPGGFGHIQKGHATAFADLDRDGDEDIYMVLGGAYEGDKFTSVLFENPGWAKNAWITLELEGRSANRSAIGARVEAVVADASGATRIVRRSVGTGGSFGAGSLQLHIGLGPAATLREVRVQWPDSARAKTSYTDLALDRTYHIVQGAAPVLLNRPAIPFRAPQSKQPADAHKGH